MRIKQILKVLHSEKKTKQTKQKWSNHHKIILYKKNLLIGLQSIIYLKIRGE